MAVLGASSTAACRDMPERCGGINVLLLPAALAAVADNGTSNRFMDETTAPDNTDRRDRCLGTLARSARTVKPA